MNHTSHSVRPALGFPADQGLPSTFSMWQPTTSLCQQIPPATGCFSHCAPSENPRLDQKLRRPLPVQRHTLRVHGEITRNKLKSSGRIREPWKGVNPPSPSREKQHLLRLSRGRPEAAGREAPAAEAMPASASPAAASLPRGCSEHVRFWDPLLVSKGTSMICVYPLLCAPLRTPWTVQP